MEYDPKKRARYFISGIFFTVTSLNIDKTNLPSVEHAVKNNVSKKDKTKMFILTFFFFNKKLTPTFPSQGDFQCSLLQPLIQGLPNMSQNNH